MLNLFYFISQAAKSDAAISKLRWIILLAMLSFIPTLFLPHAGEEGVYTISSQEMLANKDYWHTMLYGYNYPRPPLYNWLILAVTRLVGVSHILVAARIVTAISSILMALLTGWFSWRLFKNKYLSFLAVAVFLSGDLLFKRGWLAYADPTFSLFTFASMAWLWMAAKKRNTDGEGYASGKADTWWFLAAANIALICGYLTKVHTIYVFYAVTAGVLVLQTWQQRRYFNGTQHMPKVLQGGSENAQQSLSSRGDAYILLSWQSIIIHAVGLLICAIWGWFNTSGNVNSTVVDIWNLFTNEEIYSYGGKLLLFPLQIMMASLPISVVALIWWIKNKQVLRRKVYKQDLLKSEKYSGIEGKSNFKALCWILVINILPYWIAPRIHLRYLIPLYPFIAIIVAYVISFSGSDAGREQLKKWVWRLLLVGVILKVLVSVTWYPYDLTNYRGNATQIAKEIVRITAGKQLYIVSSRSIDLRVVAEINTLRYPEAPLRAPSLALLNSGSSTDAGQRIYIISMVSDPGWLQSKDGHGNGRIAAEFTMGRKKIYLLEIARLRDSDDQN